MRVQSVLMLIAICQLTDALYANEWVVRVPGGLETAQQLANELRYDLIRQVLGFDDTYIFSQLGQPVIQKRNSANLTLRLSGDSRVEWAEQQTWKRRDKRDLLLNDEQISPSLGRRRADLAVPYFGSIGFFNDELWDQQWYLQDTRTRPDLPRLDLKVIPVYEKGITGRDVRVTVLDDGLEFRHRDILPNYDPEISYDLNDGDSDPSPRYSSKEPNSHGTRCAGEIAMVANNWKCGVGVAYNAKIGGIRMLDGEAGSSMDRIEGEALNFALDKVDIYSASWGPTDDGCTVEGPGRLAREALERGVSEGRGGKGAIYVWASGNGGSKGDDCNCDGYTSSVFTLSVGSASERGQFPWYGERCASTLVSTYSSGAYSDQMIATTDLFNSCTVKHTGTSAAAPLAAGIIALALEVNPELTWRDVQHLVVWTADVAPLADNKGWQKNAAGLHVNRRFGFGLMNALAITQAAANWSTVPPWKHCTIQLKGNSTTETQTEGSARLVFSTADCEEHVNFLEHVELKATIEHAIRGQLEIFLTSPAGTRVQLLSRRPEDTSGQGFKDWSFMSVHTWGENPAGEWTVHIVDTVSKHRAQQVAN
ncbi:neuroendocrine convertase 1-like isoform X2 [Neocloeon triangulifer]|uniref:neuroendocrine convertase 1-like isoform X2 n=1 Tax=Neocloeon triangulifer TaxID=2078957 RepID=UPI00286F4DE9|nr:neuroendocrine convertase 1-like isoform X2 [Neocloeon triangulifer]